MARSCGSAQVWRRDGRACGGECGLFESRAKLDGISDWLRCWGVSGRKAHGRDGRWSRFLIPFGFVGRPACDWPAWPAAHFSTVFHVAMSQPLVPSITTPRLHNNPHSSRQQGEHGLPKDWAPWRRLRRRARLSHVSSACIMPGLHYTRPAARPAKRGLTRRVQHVARLRVGSSLPIQLYPANRRCKTTCRHWSRPVPCSTPGLLRYQV